jgi:hypothetical protein
MGHVFFLILVVWKQNVERNLILSTGKVVHVIAQEIFCFRMVNLDSIVGKAM